MHHRISCPNKYAVEFNLGTMAKVSYWFDADSMVPSILIDQSISVIICLGKLHCDELHLYVKFVTTYYIMCS